MMRPKIHLRRRRLYRFALALVCLAAIGGCVQLEGQRIRFHYDANRDRFLILVDYDGIHDSGSDSNGKGVEQIRQAIENGGVLFNDWPWSIDRDQLKKSAEDETLGPASRQLARAALENVKVQSLGYYRDFDGHIGAAQLITISHAQDFVRDANLCISENIAREAHDPKGGPWRHTIDRLTLAALSGHEWMRIDGDSIVVQLPVNRWELAIGKATAFRSLVETAFETFRKQSSDKPEEKREAEARIDGFIQALSAAPLSFADDGDSVTIRIGSAKFPSTFRLQPHPEYNDLLEKVIEKELPPFDSTLAVVVRGQRVASLPPGLTQWGIPEDRVRAVIHAAETGSDTTRSAALDWLQAFGKRWNEEEALPPAPAPAPELSATFDAWKAWYRARIAFPLAKKAS